MFSKTKGSVAVITITKDISAWELQDELWSGALDTVKTIIECDKMQDLISLLEDLFFEPVDIMKINDLLWFDADFVYEQLGIEVDGD